MLLCNFSKKRSHVACVLRTNLIICSMINTAESFIVRNFGGRCLDLISCMFYLFLVENIYWDNMSIEADCKMFLSTSLVANFEAQEISAQVGWKLKLDGMRHFRNVEEKCSSESFWKHVPMKILYWHNLATVTCPMILITSTKCLV